MRFEDFLIGTTLIIITHERNLFKFRPKLSHELSKMFTNPTAVLLGLLLIVSYSFMIRTMNSIPRSHIQVLLPRLFNLLVPPSLCQTFILFNADINANINAEPLPLFADKYYYPECYLDKEKFRTVLNSLSFATKIRNNQVLINSVYEALDVDHDGVLRWPELTSVSNETRMGSRWPIEVETDRVTFGNLMKQ